MMMKQGMKIMIMMMKDAFDKARRVDNTFAEGANGEYWWIMDS